MCVCVYARVCVCVNNAYYFFFYTFIGKSSEYILVISRQIGTKADFILFRIEGM